MGKSAQGIAVFVIDYPLIIPNVSPCGEHAHDWISQKYWYMVSIPIYTSIPLLLPSSCRIYQIIVLKKILTFPDVAIFLIYCHASPYDEIAITTQWNTINITMLPFFEGRVIGHTTFPIFKWLSLNKIDYSKYSHIKTMIIIHPPFFPILSFNISPMVTIIPPIMIPGHLRNRPKFQGIYPQFIWPEIWYSTNK